MCKYYIMSTGRDEQFRSVGYEKVEAHKSLLGTSKDGTPINGDLCYTIAHSDKSADEILAHLRGEGPMPKLNGGY